jgi:type IV pilus biogenesis protein CpaD/CtpE
VIVVCALVVLRSTGNLEIRTRRSVDPATLQAISPLLVRGYIADARHALAGELKMAAWQALDDQARQKVAQEIASNLASHGIESAELRAYRDVAIRIDAHTVAFVQEAKR